MVRNFSEKSEKLKIMLNHNGWEFSQETLAGKLRLQEYKSTLPSHPTPSLTFTNHVEPQSTSQKNI